MGGIVPECESTSLWLELGSGAGLGAIFTKCFGGTWLALSPRNDS